VSDCCEHGNELSASVRAREFLEIVVLRKEGHAPWMC
jgi:hypothetical protein